MVAVARVLSVDDEDFIAETIRRLVSRQEGMRYVGSLHSADQLLRGVEQTHANLVVLDLNMPGKDPFEAIRDVRRVDPMVRVVILSGDADPALVRRALQEGAVGFISKDEPLEVLASELRRAAEGELVLSPLVRRSLGGRWRL
jgi:DNA-binding NarL/FixJ family response regulator